MQFPYTIIVSDGYQIRTLHPPALGEYKQTVEAILEEVLDLPPVTQLSLDLRPASPNEHLQEGARGTTRTQELSGAAVVARAAGFTGDMCSQCGSMEVVRTGTCCTCQACGTPSGGCS